MAKIKGIELKGVKRFEGHDDRPGHPTYLMGNIYLDSKKVGSWAQDAWCGPDEIIINSPAVQEKICKRAEEYLTEHPDYDWHLLDLNQFKAGEKPLAVDHTGLDALEHVLWELAELSDHEKYYKKYIHKMHPNDVLSITAYKRIKAPIPVRGCYAKGHIISVQKDAE